MKRKSVGIIGMFVALFSILINLNSCSVEHFYEAEITVVNDEGIPVSNAFVETTVDVDSEYVVGREGYTNGLGQVVFNDFENVALLKVTAEKNNLYGENLLVLEEDKRVKITIVVYD
jgi:hypothetical protein